MFKKPLNFGVCPSRPVFHTAGEHPETSSEKQEATEFKAETAFDTKKEWNQQILSLVKTAMSDEKYESYIDMGFLDYITTGIDFQKFQAERQNVAKLKLEHGVIICLDDNGNKIAQFDISPAIQKILDKWKDHDCELCYRSSRRERRLLTANTGRSETWLRIRAIIKAKREGKGEDAQRKIIEAPKPPPDPQEEDAQRREQEVAAQGRQKRTNILASVEQEKEYDFPADVSPTIQNDDPKAFEKHWPFMDYGKDIDDLFQIDADPKEGYQVNPFFGQKSGKPEWNREKLRKLIQKSDHSKLYFSEVADEIYTDRFEKFKKELKEKGMPDEVLDMLDNDLLASYRKLSKIYADIRDIKDPKEIPDKYRNIFKFRPQIKEAVQILGDYIAYANKLVNLVRQLRYNQGLEAASRDATMFEGDPKAPKASNDVKRALHAIFLDGVDSPREYTSELKYLFSSDESARPITFQDLNGRTATLRTGEGLDQSPEAAYKLALEQIGDQEKDKDGKWVERVTEDDAKNHLNNLLQFGIAAYTAGPKTRGIRGVMDDLTKAGVELSPGVKFGFSGDLKADTRNLFTVLSLKNLNDLYAKDSEKAKLISRERTRFIRLGSVVYQKNKFNEAERKQSERERQAAEKAAGIKLSPEDAESICAELRKSGRFNEEQLAKLKGALIGGAVVVLPSHGGAFNIHYEFDNGVTIDFTGAFPQWESFAAGATIGKKFDAGNDITISINATAGYSFANNAGGGWSAGGGLSITKKLESVDVSIVGGGGVLLGPMIPVGFTGLGLNWAKTQERYEETLTKKEVQTGIAELDKNPDTIYTEVKNNPSKYPAITRIYDQVDNIPNLDTASKRDMFNSAYSMFKTGIQGEAIDDSAKNWYEKFVPTGAGLGVVMVGPIPVPYAYLEFNLWSRNLVYRIATPVQRANQISEAQATEKILENYGKSGSKVESKILATTDELTLDPKTGRLVLKSVKGGGIDFSHLDKFGQFTDALSRDAKIFVEQDKDGLLRLKPQEAYGNVEIYVDPELKDDVIVVTKPGDAHLYLSVKTGKQIFFKREDVTFPFEERGAVERTVVTISANPYVSTDTIQKQSQWHIDRTPTTTWIKRPHAGYGIAETQKPQDNIKTQEEYKKWWGQEGKTDRLKFVDAAEFKRAHEGLVKSITIAQERENADVKIRPEIRGKIEKLTKDKKFLNHFRALTTERFDLKNPRHKPPVGNWDIDFPELVRDLKTKLAVPDLNEYETNAAIMALLIASFQNIHKSGDPEKAKAEYLKFLESFERPMMTAILKEYYKNDPDKDKKTTDAVNYIIEQLKGVDINAPGEKVTESTLFGTLVGMSGITGIRKLYNYRETDPEWGVVGNRTLDVTKKDVSGEVADFWVARLSTYVPGLQEKEKWNLNKDAIYENMNSPLALKLAPLVSVIFNPEEMEDLTNYYKKTKREAQITNDNKDTIKKFLGWCDKVRQAELNGEKEVKLDENFKIKLDLKVSMGIYKECGNITGLVRETFALINEDRKQIYYYAGFGEGIIDVDYTYTRTDFYIMAGVALPLPREQRVAEREKPPPDKHRPPPNNPPEKPTPPTTPPEPPKQPTPPEIPTVEEIPHPQPNPQGGVEIAGGTGTDVSGGTTAGETTEKPPGVTSGGDSSAGVQ